MPFRRTWRTATRSDPARRARFAQRKRRGLRGCKATIRSCCGPGGEETRFGAGSCGGQLRGGVDPCADAARLKILEPSRSNPKRGGRPGRGATGRATSRREPKDSHRVEAEVRPTSPVSSRQQALQLERAVKEPMRNRAVGLRVANAENGRIHRGWSTYEAQQAQRVAINGKSGGRQNRPDTRNPLPWVATGRLKRSMVSRASAVGCHPLRDTPDPTDLEDHGRAKADAAEAGTPSSPTVFPCLGSRARARLPDRALLQS